MYLSLLLFQCLCPRLLSILFWFHFYYFPYIPFTKNLLYFFCLSLLPKRLGLTTQLAGCDADWGCLVLQRLQPLYELLGVLERMHAQYRRPGRERRIGCYCTWLWVPIFLATGIAGTCFFLKLTRGFSLQFMLVQQLLWLPPYSCSYGLVVMC
jgi:hypothetical protein